MLINSVQLPVARYLDDPFGNPVSASGPWSEINRYGFSSEYARMGTGNNKNGEFRPHLALFPRERVTI